MAGSDHWVRMVTEVWGLGQLRGHVTCAVTLGTLP